MELLFILFALLVLILLNGAFALSEIAVVSSDRTRLEQMQERGNRGAEAAVELSEAPNRFLSTVQIGITLVGILSGAFAQATLSRKLAAPIGEVPALAPYAQTIASVVVVGAITYVTLVLGELAPKRLAMQTPETLAAAVAPTMRWLSRVTAPLVRLLSASTALVLRLVGRQGRTEQPMTEAEIRAKILEGARQGTLERAESDLAANVLRLDDERVSAIMRPRSEAAWLDLAAAPDAAAIRKLLIRQPSGVPVARNDLNQVLGVLTVREWLERPEGAADEALPADLPRMLQKPLQVFHGASPLEVLERFKEHRTHLALVVDEYGNVQGVVTLDDVLKAIVGYVPETAEPPDPEVTRRGDGTWLLDGMLPIDRFKELFEIRQLPGEERGAFYSLGGFVMARLGRVPHVSDRLEWENLRFEVVDMDGSRVDKVLVEEARRERRAA